MPKFGDYTASTAPNQGDLLLIKDINTNSTKKITRSNLLVGTALPTNTVTTAAITDSNVTTAKVADNAITAAKLATSAIKLGYKTIVVQSTGATTETLVTLSTGTDIQVTVPSGGRDVMVKFTVSFTKTTADGNITFRIKDGGTTGSSNLRTYIETKQFVGGKGTCTGWVTIAAPSPGSRTFALTYQTSNNGISIEEGELRVENC